MSVSAISSPLTAASSAASTSKNSGTLGQVDFLNLLTTQLKYQDPMNPMSNGDMASQLAQFSSLDNMQKLNANFSQMLYLQQLTQGASLVGKQITFTNPDATLPGKGVVSAVQLQNGQLQLMVGSKAISLAQVQSISAPGAS